MNHRVKLRHQDGDQVFDMPRGLELPGEEAVLRHENGKLVLEALDASHQPVSGLVEYLKTLEPLAEEEWRSQVTDDDLQPLDDDDFPFKDIQS